MRKIFGDWEKIEGGVDDNDMYTIYTIVMTVLIASAVASSLEGVSTRVLPKYLRVNLTSDGSSASSCVVPAEPLPSTHSRLFARAHSSHSSGS